MQSNIVHLASSAWFSDPAHMKIAYLASSKHKKKMYITKLLENVLQDDLILLKGTSSVFLLYIKMAFLIKRILAISN